MKEAIILAGGRGSRLKEVVSDVPKPMAPVCGKPFLSYLLQHLQSFGFRRVIISAGYMHEVIVKHFQNRFDQIEIVYVIEEQALGTGGGLRFALEQAESTQPMVFNGDSLFRISLDSFFSFHQSHHADFSIALREVENASRYGEVEIGPNHQILAFREKQASEKKGFINGGIYILNREKFLSQTKPGVFSLETDFLSRYAANGHFYGQVFHDYFIDIGIPEDFAKAQHDFRQF